MGFNLDAYLTTPEHNSLNHAGLPGVGGGGGGTIFSVNEVAHGFVPGQPIYFDSATGGWNLAQADSDTTTADALVFAVTDVDNFDYILAGELELTVGEWDVVVGATSAGLTTGEHYRLDESSLGMLTSTSPSGSISQFVLRALSTTKALVYVGEPHAAGIGGAFGVNLQNEGVPLGGPFGALNLPSSLVASDAGGGVATITQGPVGLPKRYIEGLLVEWGGTFTGADSKVIVRPGSCRSNDDLNDIALTTSTIADAAIKHTNLPGTGYAQLNGMDEKGLDDLAVGAITCSQAGNVVTTTASIIPHLTDHVLTGTMSTSGTALNGTVVAGPHLPGATRFEDELAVGDLVGNSTVGWSRVVAVNGYNSATLLTALAMGASSTATVIHQPTITPNDFIISGFTDKIDTIDSTGTSINVPTVAAVAPGSNLTIGRFVPDMWLAVWLIDDDGTNGPGLLLSTQHVNPISPPPGYTKFRRVGWVYIETQIPFPGYNIREMYYADGGVTRDVVYEIEDQPAQVAVQNPTTWTVVDFNAVAPRTARRLELRVVGDNSANGSIGLIYLRHLPGTSGPGTVARGRRLGIGANESHGHAVMMAPCNGIQQIQYAVDNVNLFASIMLIGFVDTL
jgi:hypothetical protein